MLTLSIKRRAVWVFALGAILGTHLAWGAASASYTMIPDTGEEGIANPQRTEALLSTTEMRCGPFVASKGMTDAKSMAVWITEGANPTTLGLCIYNADGSLVRKSGAMTCSPLSPGGALCAVQDLVAFSLVEGTKYFLCWTSNDTSLRMVSAGSIDLGMVNAFVTNQGIGAAPSSAGVCADTMGSLSQTFGSPQLPEVFISKEQ